jgi:hypothetical protein
MVILSQGSGGSPQIDLAILTLADHTVLHCPSSFSNVSTPGNIRRQFRPRIVGSFYRVHAPPLLGADCQAAARLSEHLHVSGWCGGRAVC